MIKGRNKIVGNISSPKKVTGNVIKSKLEIIGRTKAVGRDGIGLDFIWDGLKLGIKKEDELEYKYVDLSANIDYETLISILGFVPTDSNELELHIKNHISHITGVERDYWNEKVDIEELPTKLSELDNDLDMLSDIDVTNMILEATKNLIDKSTFTSSIDEVKSTIKSVDDKKVNIEIFEDVVKDLNNDIDILNNNIIEVDGNKLDKSVFSEEFTKHKDSNTHITNKERLLWNSKADHSDIDSEINKVIDIIENLDIPDNETLENILKELDRLKSGKVDFDLFDATISNIRISIMELEIPDVELVDSMNKLLNSVDTKLSNHLNNKDVHLTAKDKTQLSYIPLKAGKDELDNHISSNLHVSSVNREYWNNKADKSLLIKEIGRLEELIGNIDIPETDLTEIVKSIENLSMNKADKSLLISEVNRLENLINSIEIPPEIDLTEVYTLIDNIKLDLNSHMESDHLHLNDSDIKEIDKIKNKADKIDIPTKVSQLENDNSYITLEEIPNIDLSEIESDIENIKKVDVRQDSLLDDFDIKIKEIMENYDITSSEILDLIARFDNYYTKDEHDKHTDDRIQQLVGDAPEALDTLVELAEALGNDPNFATTTIKKLNTKVDKVEGKSLSSNDFTDSLKDKLILLEHITKISQLKQDIPYLLDEDLNFIRDNIENNSNLIESEVIRIESIIENLNIPDEVDLTPVYSELDKLKGEKLDISEFETKLDLALNKIKEYLENELSKVNIKLDDKANKIDIPTKLSQLEDDIDIGSNISKLQADKASKAELNVVKEELENIINNIDIPEVDLSEIEVELERLNTIKVSKSDVDNSIDSVIELVESKLISQLNIINESLENKSNVDHTHSQYLEQKDLPPKGEVSVRDTRNINHSPKDFMKISNEGEKVYFEFKSFNSVDQPPVSSSNNKYVYLMTFAGWRDPSGGYPIQLAWGSEGFAFREGVSEDKWSSWEKYSDDSFIIKNIPTKFYHQGKTPPNNTNLMWIDNS